MALLLTMTFQHINTSIQAGDLVYYVPTQPSGTSTSIMTFDTGIHGNIIKFGYVMDIDRSTGEVSVVWDDEGVPEPPKKTYFILFSKDKQANTSSLLGYYANIKLENDSNEKVELFSVSSEVVESSK